MFMSALLVTAPNCKQQIGEWINTYLHSYNGILFRNKRKWTIKPQKHMEQQYLHIVSERIHYETVPYSMISTRETIKKKLLLVRIFGERQKR